MKKTVFILTIAALFCGCIANEPKKSLNKVAEPVDLGLSVDWASFNLGADDIEDIGAYFAWGEKYDKAYYTWTTYMLCDGSDSVMIRYNAKDQLTTLTPDDDAAHANWGGKWRMPTEKEWQELINFCTWEEKSSGWRITSKNGKSIFLPKTGYYTPGSQIVSRDAKKSTLIDEGNGYYWTCNLGNKSWITSVIVDSDDNCYARNFEINSMKKDVIGSRRCLGMAIRPVCDK